MKFFAKSPKEKKVIIGLIESYLEKLTSTKSDFPLLLELSMVYIKINENLQSLNYLTKAEEINPCFEVFFLKGMLYFIEARYHQSLEYLIKAIKENPKEFHFFSIEGINYLVKNSAKIENSEKIMNEETLLLFIYEQTIKMIHENPLPIKKVEELYNKGTQYIFEGNKEKALENLEKAKVESGLEHKYPQYNNLSIKDWEKEFPHLDYDIKEKEKTIGKSGNINFNDYIELGKMYFLKRNYEQAENSFSIAKKLFLKTLK